MFLSMSMSMNRLHAESRADVTLQEVTHLLPRPWEVTRQFEGAYGNSSCAVSDEGYLADETSALELSYCSSLVLDTHQPVINVLFVCSWGFCRIN
jgi:hypothetical protein